MLLSHGMFLSNKVHESRFLRRERGIQTRNHAILGMEMCSALVRSTGVCIDFKLSWLRQVVHLVSGSYFSTENLLSKVRKNTEKAEMGQKRFAQQEHGKNEKHKS